MGPLTYYLIDTKFFKGKKKEYKMKFKPLLDRVVLKRVEEENRTAGGLIIPDTAKEKPSKESLWLSARAVVMKTGNWLR